MKLKISELLVLHDKGLLPRYLIERYKQVNSVEGSLMEDISGTNNVNWLLNRLSAIALIPITVFVTLYCSDHNKNQFALGGACAMVLIVFFLLLGRLFSFCFSSSLADHLDGLRRSLGLSWKQLTSMTEEECIEHADRKLLYKTALVKNAERVRGMNSAEAEKRRLDFKTALAFCLLFGFGSEKEGTYYDRSDKVELATEDQLKLEEEKTEAVSV